MHLTPQQQLIIAMLADGEYHCPTIELYMKDDRKRISELKQMGYNIDSTKYCTTEVHHHKSKVKLRKLIPNVSIARSEQIIQTEPQSGNVGLFPTTVGIKEAYKRI